MSATKGSALIYCRVSTINQAEEGTSLDSQESACVALAQALGYTVGRVTREVYSGAELWDRPKLSQDRADLKAGQYSALVCYSTDRLSRDPIHLAIIAEECERAGVALHFVSETFDDSDEGELIRYVKGYSHKKERAQFRERSLRGNYTRALKGKVHGAGSELYGYRRDKEKGVREVYDPEAAIIRQIFAWVAQDRLPVRTVARRLNDEGVPPPSTDKLTYRTDGRQAPRWGKSQIRRILEHPAYKGEAVAWRWRHQSKDAPALRPESEWIRLPDGVVPPIVSPALWQEAHDALTQHRGESTRNAARPSLLRGHIWCSVCGNRMQPMRENTSQPSGGRRIYRCSSRDTASGACGGKRIPAEDVEAWAWDRIVWTLRHPDVIAAELARREAEGPDAVLSADLATARRQLAACERAQDKLMQRYAAAVASDGDAAKEDALWKLTEREINRLEAQKASYTRTIAQIEKRLTDARLAQVQLAQLHDSCARLEANLTAATFDDKRLALAALDVRVTGNGRDWAIRGSIPLDVPDPAVALETITCA